MSKSFLVVGLGRFGESITKSLAAMGHEVMVLDKDEKKIQKIAPVATQAVTVDATDEDALKDLGVSNLDEAIIGIGEDIHASILITLILKDMGFEKVVVKAKNDYHSKILDKIGADQIVHAERDMGARVAHNILSQNVIDFIELSAEYSLVEIYASRKMHNKSIETLKIRAKYGCTVMAIKSEDDEMNIAPEPGDVIRRHDIVLIVGKREDINRLENELLDKTGHVIL